MKTNSLYLLLCLSLLTLLPSKTKASHAAGAELLYEWVSDSTYRFYYKFYRFCGGATEPGTVGVCYYNSCNSTTGTITLNKIVTLPDGRPNGSEVSPGCPGFPTKCTQTSSALPGFQEWWYSGTVTLPRRCDHWTFSYALSARNTSVTNINGGSLFVEATLDNETAQGNTSPFFSVKPVPYVCNNIPYTYNNGAFDRNNDFLSFEMLQPRTNGTSCTGTNLAYRPPFGSDPPYNITTNPLACNNTFNLDASNGQMSFTPNQIQQGVVAVRVSETRNGKVIGTVMRDIQVTVITCNNVQPELDVINSTVTGAAYNDTTVTGCMAQPLSFCFNITSSNPGAVLIARDNSGTSLPGSSVTYANQQSANITGCLSWTPGGISDTGLKILTVTVIDSSCAPPGILISNTYTIPIYISPFTTAYRDTSICPGDTVHLLATGAGNFTWDVLPGGSPVTSLSCTNCRNPIAAPTQTTTYTVLSQIGSLCSSRDTVTISVASAITSVNAGPDLITCVNDSLQIPLNVVVSGGYKVKWSPATYLSNDTTLNPFTKPYDDIEYRVKITSSSVAECAVWDTINVAVLKGYNVANGDTAICRGDVVQINANGDNRYTYLWTPDTGVSNVNILNPLITTDSTRTYTITATYPGCTDSVQKLAIEVQPVPTVIVLDDQTICLGDTVHLTTVVTPPYDRYTFTWTPGSGLDHPDAQSPVFSGKISGQLKLEVNTPIGCKSSDSLNIKVVNVKFLKISNDTLMCPNDSVQLHIEGDSLASFYWHPNFHINDTLSTDPFVSPERTQYYTVYGIDSTNCKDTVEVLVTVKPAAIITLPDSVLIYPGDSYQLDPQTNCMYFTWFPYIGLTNPNISNPIASPDASTRYFVLGMTESGCRTIDSIDVLMSDDSQIDMPNAFAPGNGPNNILRVIHLGRATLKSFTVYNRWGVKLFETSNLAEGWDGMFNGQPQPLGVYVYVIEAQTYRGRVVRKQGNITLLR